MKKPTSFSLNNEEGFGIWGAIVLLALIFFIVAVAMKTLSIWTAIIGFIAVFVAVMFLMSLPGIIRYGKISSM
ncbi:hypothetical protein BH20ACI4_BH20ACI4_03730 [soil metagenome]